MAALENSPLAVLVLADRNEVIHANRAAREMLGIWRSQLPASLIEAIREPRLEAAVNQGPGIHEVRLSKRQLTLRVQVAPLGDGRHRALYLEDVSHLRRLETVRQDFVANLSHELRNPLTSLRLAAETLAEGPPPPIAQRLTRRILAEADNLAAIFNNLRQIAEAESGRLSVTLTTFRLDELVGEVISRSPTDRPFRVSIPESMEVTADRAKLAQVLANLIDNAIKFSPSGTPVELTAAQGPDEISIRVRDHGAGIPPSHWDRVFERFYKVDPSHSRDITGSGLGLAIVKHLVESHGGRVWTEASATGGQIFGITLPKRDPGWSGGSGLQ